MKNLYKLVLTKKEEINKKLKTEKKNLSIEFYNSQLEFYEKIIFSYKKHQKLKQSSNVN